MFVLVENAMVDGAATGALQAPSMAPAVAWAQRMTRTLPPWYPLLLRWPRGHSLTPLPTLAAMRGVVEVKEGLGVLTAGCVVGIWAWAARPVTRKCYEAIGGAPPSTPHFAPLTTAELQACNARVAVQVLPSLWRCEGRHACTQQRQK